MLISKLFIIPNTVVLFGSIFETPLSKSAEQTYRHEDIKTYIKKHITTLYR